MDTPYTNFVSKYARFSIWGAPDKEGNAKHLAQFEGTIGKRGTFSTNDPDIIDALKKSSLFNKDFFLLEKDMPQFADEHIQKGAATSSNAQQLEAIKKNLEAEKQIELERAKSEIGQKFMRFGQLKQMLLKNDGTYRADATDELKTEYEQLKNEIGV